MWSKKEWEKTEREMHARMNEEGLVGAERMTAVEQFVAEYNAAYSKRMTVRMQVRWHRIPKIVRAAIEVGIVVGAALWYAYWHDSDPTPFPWTQALFIAGTGFLILWIARWEYMDN